jgi:benzoyl-CoA-dihydrodiol lyase
MAAHETTPLEPVTFQTHPSRYKHWKLRFPDAHGGKLAELVMDVEEEGGMRKGYPLKLNSYDLGVDIELADALNRIRFEYPEVRALMFSSAKDRIFCSGANIYMLGSSGHGFKVNFCKYTNETRLGIEDLSAHTGIASIAALAGAASGGGYELAIACDEIVLQEDGNSAVSYPETPLLGVLPGTGGLTRLVDKRKVRRDLADAFSTLAEGLRGKRAKEWGLVDAAPSRSQFTAEVETRALAMIGRSARRPTTRIEWTPVEMKRSETAFEGQFVSVTFEGRAATLIVRAPQAGEPMTPAELRFNRPMTGVVAVKTEGDPRAVLAVDAMLALYKDDGLVHEVLSHARRVLKRFDMTAKSFFAIIAPQSAFAGSLLELALASDRIYMQDSEEAENTIFASALNGGFFPMGNGLSRLESRFLGAPARVGHVLESKGPIATKRAQELGLVTFAPDDLDWEDELRIAFEERASLSPDALTGMEANLRFAGPETLETKIFARLSAWQNWIFQRPNAVGEKGALTLYGKPERAEFNFQRT